MKKSMHRILSISVSLLFGCMCFVQSCFAEQYFYKDISKNAIETERLILEPVNSNDLDILSDYLMNKEVTRYLHPSLYKGFSDKNEALAFLKRDIEFESEELVGFTIKLKASRIPIGQVEALMNPGKEVMFGYWLGKDFQGKGYAQEACCSFCSQFFNALDVESVSIYCDPKNNRSYKLASKILDFLEKNANHIRLCRSQRKSLFMYGGENEIDACVFLLRKI